MTFPLPNHTPLTRADLLASWHHATRVKLPAMARAAGTWPIQADHCFMRVCLDTALGARWDTLVARPAIRHLTITQLQAAIAQAQAIISNPALLPALNQQSLHLRRQHSSRPADNPA